MLPTESRRNSGGGTKDRFGVLRNDIAGEKED